MKRYRWLSTVIVLTILATVPMFAVYRYLQKVNEKTLAVAVTRDVAAYLIEQGNSISEVDWHDFEKWNAAQGRIWRAVDMQDRYEVYKTAPATLTFPDQNKDEQRAIWRLRIKDTVQFPGISREDFSVYLERRMNERIMVEL